MTDLIKRISEATEDGITFLSEDPEVQKFETELLGRIKKHLPKEWRDKIYLDELNDLADPDTPDEYWDDIEYVDWDPYNPWDCANVIPFDERNVGPRENFQDVVELLKVTAQGARFFVFTESRIIWGRTREDAMNKILQKYVTAHRKDSKLSE